MSVIAWDGQTLCADKRAVSSGFKFKVTKIFRIKLGLIGIDGTYDAGMALIEWLENGADPKEYPEIQKDNDRNCFGLLITPEKKIIRYERLCNPILIEETYFAGGSGRDYALAAMYLGKSARKAVLVACHFDNSCGNGIDELTL